MYLEKYNFPSARFFLILSKLSEYSEKYLQKRARKVAKTAGSRRAG